MQLAGESLAVPAPPAPGVRASALYEGTVRHRRFEPVEHSFSYRLFMAYLDLDELPGVLDPYPLWSARRPAPTRFRRADFMGPAERSLAECARDEVEAATGRRPIGPVRLLTGLRHFGHHFNPVSFYYCFSEYGRCLEAVIADVKNIPWGERHPYVLAREGGSGGVVRGEFEKVLHVSPLMDMDHRYSLRTLEPGETVSVHIESRPVDRSPTAEAPAEGARAADAAPVAGDEPERPKAFDATLSLRRHELSRASTSRMLARYPLMSLRVVAGIYWQSLQLKRRGAEYAPHPQDHRPKGFLSP